MTCNHPLNPRKLTQTLLNGKKRGKDMLMACRVISVFSKLITERIKLSL